MKGIISLFTIGMCMFLLSGKVHGAVPAQVVKKELEYMLKHDFNLKVSALKNKRLVRHENTLHNVRKSSLVKVKQISLTKAEKYIPNLPQYISKFGRENVQVYHIVARYDVQKENTYQKDGMNYFLQVLVQEQGDWRIVENVALSAEEVMKNGAAFGMKK